MEAEPVYFWGEDGVMRHTTRSLLSAIAHAIERNVGITQSPDPDDDLTDSPETIDILKKLFECIRKTGREIQLTLRDVPGGDDNDDEKPTET